MSSSILIPTRTAGYGESSKAGAASASSSSSSRSSSSSSSYSSSPRMPNQQTASAPASPNPRYGHDRRPSLLSMPHLPIPAKLRIWDPSPPMDHLASRSVDKTKDDIPEAHSSLGSSLSRQEHTVINIGDPDGPPRLVSLSSGSSGRIDPLLSNTRLPRLLASDPLRALIGTLVRPFGFLALS